MENLQNEKLNNLQTEQSVQDVLPSSDLIRKEITREMKKDSSKSVLRGAVITLITVAALAILVATLWLPVLRIYGSSMSPTLREGELVVSVKSDKFQPGDVIAFYYNNKVLVKRVVASAGDWVDIDLDGNVYRNGNMLNEPYIQEHALGECDIKLPYQVPENRVFVMGDNRSVSIDSRSTSIGCVAEEQVVGKLTFCIWPLKEFGKITTGRRV